MHAWFNTTQFDRVVCFAQSTDVSYFGEACTHQIGWIFLSFSKREGGGVNFDPKTFCHFFWQWVAQKFREKMPDDFQKNPKSFPRVFLGYISGGKWQMIFQKIQRVSFGVFSGLFFEEKMPECPVFSDSDTFFFRSTIITADTVNTVRTFSRLHLLIAFSSCIMKTNRCKKFIWNCTQLEPEKKQKLVLKWTLVLASRTNSRRGGISFDDLFQRES